MPNALYVTPGRLEQDTQLERSVLGCVPAPQLSQAVFASLALLPSSSHVVQLAPLKLTDPVGQPEHCVSPEEASPQPAAV